MSRHTIPPSGGAVPTARRDEKMGAEHADLFFGPRRGAWTKMIKRTATKKRRQHDKDAARVDG